jgi:hypothetical protein
MPLKLGKELKTKIIPVPDPVSEKKESFAFHKDPIWRILSLTSEFVGGFQFLHRLKKEVSIFGSTRFSSRNYYYRKARQLAKKLGKEGYSIVTGGGPGIMEAANRGAQEAEAVSVGLNIELPTEQKLNEYVDRSYGFHFFTSRKVMLSASSQCYIFFPGGYGTLEEFFEIIVILTTDVTLQHIPVVCFDKKYWDPLIKFLEKIVYYENGCITEDMLDLIIVTDTVKEAYQEVQKSKERIYF